MDKHNYVWAILVAFLFLLLACENNYKDGMKEYEAEEYELALEYFNRISEGEDNFEESQKMIQAIDSIFEAERIEQARQDSIARITSYQKRIFRELIRKQDEATEMAQNRYPNDIHQQIDYETQLDEQFTEEIADRWEITRDSISAISLKGVQEGWPMPDL